MSLKILILEDDQNRIETFRKKLYTRHVLFFVETAADAIAWIRSEAESGHPFDVIFLDHDLGGETYVDVKNTNTGSEVVRWLTSYQGTLSQPYIVIHSMNEPAAVSMRQKLEQHGFEFIYRIPFTQLVSKYLDDPNFLQ